MDNVSQTSDYSSGSDRSSNGNHRMFHPTHFEGSYSSGIVHDRGFMGNQIQSRQVDDAKRLPYCSQGSVFPPVNHQVLSRPHHLGSSDLNVLNNEGMNNFQTKALVHENSRLKNEVVMLKKKCKKIQECENQFVELQSQYESLVKTTVRRQAYEQALRSRHSGTPHVHARKLVSSGTQTFNIISSREHDNEIISLKMMLREKEELILNLLRERERKAGAFCPDSLHEDYIAANVVSL